MIKINWEYIPKIRLNKNVKFLFLNLKKIGIGISNIGIFYWW